MCDLELFVNKTDLAIIKELVIVIVIIASV